MIENDIKETSKVVKELISLLKKGNAHASFDDAVKDISFDDLGKKPYNLPYSIWQLTKHIQIAQNDILEFSSDKHYTEKNWPADYWPKEASPKNEAEWKDCLSDIKSDLNAFINLLKDEDAELYKTFEYGEGQTLLHEAFLIANHTGYHTAEIIVLRRLLGNWQKN